MVPFGRVRRMEKLNQRTGTEPRNAIAVVSTEQRPDVVVRRPHRLTQELPPPDGN